MTIRIKRLLRMIFSRTSRWVLTFGRSLFNYAGEVGDPMAASTVAAPVLWFARNFPEAPPAMWEQIDEGPGEYEVQVRRHPLLDLLQRPNGHYTGPLLWMATTTDWNVNGNAYWIVVPNRAGTPVELWWTPSWQMEPKGDDADPSVYVRYYEYTIDGEPHRLDPRYVIHFRNGLDAENPRKGCSPLRSVLREVFTDNEAADFTASLLRNMGVPGLLVSPEGAVTIPDEEARETKEDLKAMFTGDRRGEPIVMTGATKIQQFGFSPEQLLLRELRRVPEERVTAVLGVPAIVAGLGAGLDRSTFTNMAEARVAAYESGLIPGQKILGEDVRFQLLPLFGEDPFEWRFGFDLSRVRVMQEDLYRQALRLDLAVRGGWAMIKEARRPMGLDVDEERDSVFLRPANATQVDGQSGRFSPLAPSRNGNGSGSGAHPSEPELIAQHVVEALRRDALAPV